MSVTPTKIDTRTSKTFVLAWLAMPADSDGAVTAGAQFAGQHSDKSVQVSGVFGGASVVLQGTNDGANWFSLTDAQGNALTFTAAGLKLVAEATWKVRPVVTGGDGTTAVDVHLLMKEV